MPPKNHRAPDAEALLLLQKAVTDELGEDERQRFLERFENESDWSDRLAKELISDHLLHEVYERSRLLDAVEPSSEVPDIRTDILDTDTLARLAAESPALPKTNRDETVPLPSPHRKSIKPFDPNTARPLIPWRFTIPLLLFFFGMIVYSEWNSRTDHEGNEISGEKHGLTVMSDQADVVWTKDSMRPKLGESLSAGALEFDSGTVELLFFDGVRCVVEGPADLILLKEGRVFCRHGNWSVTVPPSGVGFEIQTPQYTIRDLGTQFFAAIDEKNCDIHVLKGAVELRNDAGKKKVYKTNQAVEIRSGKLFDRLMETDVFVSKKEMRLRSDDYLQRHPPPPKQQSEPILSVDFSGETPQGVTLFSGRHEGSAFRFTDAESRIRLPSLGRLSSFTVLIDIKVDRLNTKLNPILMSAGSKRDGLIWNILPQGSMAVGFRGRGTFRTPIVFTKESLGQWVRLGLGVDEKQMKIYLNGDPVCSVARSTVGPLDSSAWDIGNWENKGTIEPLDGAVAGIKIFDRCLELHEIRAVSE